MEASKPVKPVSSGKGPLRTERLKRLQQLRERLKLAKKP
jgi:hypothetical protein